MEPGVPFTIDNFISNWNGDFPNYPLTAADLKKAHAMMGALLHVFDRLDIDCDAVLNMSPDEIPSESFMYYRDLVPVINTARATHHLVSVMPQVAANTTFSIMNFLQPTTSFSHSILLMLFNLMWFNEDRLREIAPFEGELFAKTDQLKTLEEQKHKLLMLLNEKAEEKGKRAERLNSLDDEIKQLEEELKQETEPHDLEKLELDALLKENHQMEILAEQKKTHRDAVLAEVARKEALRVYDAEDSKAQAEQSAQNIQEADKKLNALRKFHMQKDTSLKNLQTIKPSLDTANNLLLEIMKLSDSLKDLECGDFDSDSKDGELDVLNTELSELQVQLRELQTARAELADRHRETCAKCQQDKAELMSEFHEAEEEDRKRRENSKKEVQRTEEIKQLTFQYEKEKAAGMEEVAALKDSFCRELKSIEETLLKKMIELEKEVDEKLRNRNNGL